MKLGMCVCDVWWNQLPYKAQLDQNTTMNWSSVEHMLHTHPIIDYKGGRNVYDAMSVYCSTLLSFGATCMYFYDVTNITYNVHSQAYEGVVNRCGQSKVHVLFVALLALLKY